MMKSIIVRGKKIAYFEKNSNKSNVLLLLHNNSSSSISFKHQFFSEELSSYRIIAPDLPGHGESEHLESYSLPIFAEYLNAFIDQLGLKQIHILGHSLGGHIAIQMGESSNVSGITIWGTIPFKNPCTFEGYQLNSKAEVLKSNECSDENLAHYLDKLKLTSAEYLVARFDYKRTDPKFREILAASLMENKHLDEWKILRNFSGSKNIITMNLDSVIDNSYLKQETEGFPNINLYQLDSSHSPHQTSESEFNFLINTIVQRYNVLKGDAFNYDRFSVHS